MLRCQVAVRLDKGKLELLVGHVVKIAAGLDPDIDLASRSQAGGVRGHMEQGGVGGAHLDSQEHLSNVGHIEQGDMVVGARAGGELQDLGGTESESLAV